MNLIEAVRQMRPLQIVSSKDAQDRLILDKLDFVLNHYSDDGVVGDPLVLTGNEWGADDWEIEEA